MRKNKKGILLVAVVVLTVVLGGFVLGGCDDKEEDVLYVGLECAYAPFNFTQMADDANGAVKIDNAEGWANGYDVMIAKRIAEGLGKRLVIKQYSWDGLLPGVTSGALDLIIAGMSPTAERLEAIDFSDPYYESNLVIVVRKDGKYANATSLADFAGATVAAQLGTFHDTALEEQGRQFGITRATPMDDFPALINALKSKAIDGYVAEDPGAKADCASNSELKVISLVNNDTGFDTGDGDSAIAVGMKKGCEYKDEINRILAGISTEERIEMMDEAVKLASGKLTVSEISQMILSGVGYTLLVALIGTVAGLLIGILVGVARTAETPKNKVAAVFKKIGDFLLSAYIEVFRGTPMMVQAMVIFWGFALLADGQTMNVVLAGLIIVSINTGAYMAEIVRGGIISVDKGQFEGAQAIGMTHSQTMQNVVLPQALRNIMPSVANEFVINIKDTSVLNVIGFTELFYAARSIVSVNYETFKTYLLVAGVYFVLTFVITRILRLVEKKMDGGDNYKIMGSQNMDAESIVKENKILGGND